MNYGFSKTLDIPFEQAIEKVTEELKKEGKIKRSKNRPKGLRLRKTARGKVISQDIVQINLKILKEGNKKLSEIFPEQNKPKENKEESKEKIEEKEKEVTAENSQ